MALKKTRGGVRRAGSGRPRPGGRGSSMKARINRVVVMLDEDDYKKLERHARRTKLPLGTAAFEIMNRALRRM